jgi:hypothetical protein
MNAPLDYRIVEAIAEPASYSVRLRWASGAETVATFAHLVGKGVFASLADQAFFSKAAVGARGRTLTWPGDIDFCADALWFEAHPEDNPFANSPEAAA